MTRGSADTVRMSEGDVLGNLCANERIQRASPFVGIVENKYVSDQESVSAILSLLSPGSSLIPGRVLGAQIPMKKDALFPASFDYFSLSTSTFNDQGVGLDECPEEASPELGSYSWSDVRALAVRLRDKPHFDEG